MREDPTPRKKPAEVRTRVGDFSHLEKSLFGLRLPKVFLLYLPISAGYVLLGILRRFPRRDFPEWDTGCHFWCGGGCRRRQGCVRVQRNWFLFLRTRWVVVQVGLWGFGWGGRWGVVEERFGGFGGLWCGVGWGCGGSGLVWRRGGWSFESVTVRVRCFSSMGTPSLPCALSVQWVPLGRLLVFVYRQRRKVETVGDADRLRVPVRHLSLALVADDG